MRRLQLEHSFARTARWSARVVLLSFVIAVVAVVLSYRQALEPVYVLSLLSVSLVLACLAFLMSCAAFVIIWRDGSSGVGAAVMGFIGALILMGLAAYLLYLSIALPLLADISTDLVDPPAFSRDPRIIAKRGGWMPPDIDSALRQKQKPAYNQIQPLVEAMEADEAYKLAQRTVGLLHWYVLESNPPSLRSSTASIEVLDKSPLLGFPVAIVIRIKITDGETRIDLRATSRYGRHDFGVDAAKIQTFVDRFSALTEH